MKASSVLEERQTSVNINDRRTWLRQAEPSIVDEWITKGYTHVPFNPPQGLVASVFEGFQHFIESKSFEEKRLWGFGASEDPDIGLLPRLDKDGKPMVNEYANDGMENDNKHTFHYRRSLISHLDARGVYYKPQIPWLNNCHKLFQYCYTQGLRDQHSIDADPEKRLGSGHVERYTNAIAEEEHTLRIICYLNELQPGAKLCSGHVDRCWSTYQVAETDPGLKVIGKDKTFYYEPLPGKALFFPGQKAPYATKEAIEGTYHICQVPETYRPSRENKLRFAMIFFMHEAGEEIPRLREYADGTKTAAELQKFRAYKAAKKKLREEAQRHRLTVVPTPVVGK